MTRISFRLAVLSVLLFIAFGELLGQRKNGFNLSESIIPIDEIKSGGPPKDGIPALTKPKFISADNAKYLNPKDKVIGVSINGEHRAYPIKILNYHEIVNDDVGSTPIVISYCPLCGSGLVFSAIFDSRILNFGVSGLLYNSDVLMYDKQTNSLWSQLMMQAISGKMKDQKLVFIESEHTTWKGWLAQHPDTKVLSDKTGHSRDYSRNPYEGYTRTPTLYFTVKHESDALPGKKQVLGIEVDGQYKAYSFSDLHKAGTLIEDSFNGVDFTISFDSPNRSAKIIKSSQPIVYLTTYWFAWYTFHPETELYIAK